MKTRRRCVLLWQTSTFLEILCQFCDVSFKSKFKQRGEMKCCD